jgi:hypothetical protein
MQRPKSWQGLPVALCLSLALCGAPCLGHDHSRPDLNAWYRGLHSEIGVCCDGDEVTHLADVDWESHDGHYRVRIDGEWVDVPDAALLRGPNLAGPTMVWPYYLNGHPQVRCFMPGALG